MWSASTFRQTRTPAGRSRRRTGTSSGPATLAAQGRAPRTKKHLLGCALAIGLAGIPPASAEETAAWQRKIEALVQQGQLDEAAGLATGALQEPGTAAAAWAWLGRVSMATGQFGEAHEHFARAREMGANVAGFAEPWSTALVRIGRRNDACTLLGDAAGESPNNPSLRYLAGSCLLRLDLPREALPHLEAAGKLGIAHSGARLDLARARLEAGMEDVAVEQLLEMTVQAEAPGTLLAIGRLLFERVLYRQALVPLSKAFAARPGWYEAGMYLGLAHYQLEQYSECADVVDTFADEPGSAESRLLLGSALARLGKPEDARRELEAVIEMTPDRADGYLNLGLFLLENRTREDALEVLEQSAARDARGAKVLYRIGSRNDCQGLAPPAPGQSGNGSSSRYLTEFADSLLAGQQWGSALELYLAALSLDARLARPYGGIGLICQELGSASVGMDFLRQGLRLHPSNSELHYYQGSLFDYLSQPLAAIESYERALALGGKGLAPPRYWLRLGLAQVAVGREAQAEASFQAALEREPEFAEAHYRIGRLRLGQGRYGEAEKYLERAVALDPFLTEAYYSWGLACLRNGNREAGRAILESHRRKASLREAAGGMQ